jgi:hypothetical protein
MEEIILLAGNAAKVAGKVSGKGADDIPESLASKVLRKERMAADKWKESQEEEDQSEEAPTPQTASMDATAASVGTSDGDSCCCCCAGDDCCCSAVHSVMECICCCF